MGGTPSRHPVVMTITTRTLKPMVTTGGSNPMQARLQVASAAICRGHCTSWCFFEPPRWMINIAMLAMLEWGIPAYHIFGPTQFLVLTVFLRSIPRFWWLKWLKCPFFSNIFLGVPEFHGSFRLPIEAPGKPQVTVASYFVSHLENAGGGALELGTVAKFRPNVLSTS